MTQNPEFLDVFGADHVEIRVSHDRTVLWINVDGICRLRVCRIRALTVEGRLDADPPRTLLENGNDHAGR